MARLLVEEQHPVVPEGSAMYLEIGSKGAPERGCLHMTPLPTGSRRLLPGLQLPGADHRVFHGIGIPVLKVRDHHHVLREALRHREGLGERLEQEVSRLERRTNDDVAVVELPRHQAAAIPPIKQALPTTLGDTIELGSETTEVRDRHRVIVAGRSRMSARRNTTCRDDARPALEGHLPLHPRWQVDDKVGADDTPDLREWLGMLFRGEEDYGSLTPVTRACAISRSIADAPSRSVKFESG